VSSEISEHGLISAGLRLRSGHSLVFKREPLAEDFARRELRAAQRLITTTDSSSGHVQLYFDARVVGATVYTLAEAGDVDLEEFLGQEGAQHGRALPLNRSLPILVDVLRGLEELTSARILHEGLSTRDVLFIDGRAVISGLQGAALERLEVPYFAEADLGKRHAMAAGRVFARLCLGRDLAAAEPGPAPQATAAPSAEGLGELEEDVRRILHGMLAPDLQTRWDCKRSLREVEELARRRGIEVPTPRAALLADP